MLQLQRNVAPPVAAPKTDARKKYPFDTMQVNDFFFVAGKSKNSIRSYFSTIGKANGIKLTSRLIHARKDAAGNWKPVGEGEDLDGATIGVGVWRTE